MSKDPNAPTPDPPSADPPSALDQCLMILLVLWPLMLIAALPVLSAIPTPSAEGGAVPTRATVNPNVAPWWELTVLPRVGETIAHRIVRYRESVGSAEGGSGSGPDSPKTKVFRRPADLSKIRGIGPKTLQRMGRYLHFDDE